MRSARVYLALFFLIFASLFVAPKLAQAQTPSNTTNNFAAPRTDPDVPQNQHTFAQTVTIEVMSAVICQITGIDPIDPTLGCVGINPQTRKLGLIKPTLDANGRTELGGMLGTTTDLIAFTYQPVVTTSAYSQYLTENFGIVKKAYAQTGYGFDGLRPILKLWETVRNIAYILLTIAFIFIGVGVMMRVKIDPRTVMSIQNQIPKVIIAIILITMSYAISAIMIDLMWVTTYAGVNILSKNAEQNGIGGAGSETLYYKASKNILNNPLSFTNQIFESPKPGVFHITQSVSNNVGSMLGEIIRDVLGRQDGEKCIDPSIKALLPGGPKFIDFGACLGGIVSWLASITLKLVILAVLMVTLFKIWFNLLKAYVYTILYVIISPVMIVFGLLPSKPMGFENWLRRLFVNVAVFPLTAFLIVAARLLMDLYNKDDYNLFVPPLVGNPSGVNFGSLLAFGAILITPHLQTILQEKMGVKGIGSPGLIAAGLAGGAAVVGAPVGRAMKHLNRRDQRGGAVGSLALGKEMIGEKAIGIPARLGSKFAARQLEEREFKKTGDYLSGKKAFSTESGELKKQFKGMSRKDVRDYKAGVRYKDKAKDKDGNPIPPSTPPSGGSSTGGRTRFRDRLKILNPIRRNRRGDDDPPPATGAPVVPPHTPSGGPASTASTHTPTGTGSSSTVENLTVNAANVKLINPDLTGLSSHMSASTENAEHVQRRFTEEADKIPALRGKTPAEILARKEGSTEMQEARRILKQIEDEEIGRA